MLQASSSRDDPEGAAAEPGASGSLRGASTPPTGAEVVLVVLVDGVEDEAGSGRAGARPGEAAGAGGGASSAGGGGGGGSGE